MPYHVDGTQLPFEKRIGVIVLTTSLAIFASGCQTTQSGSGNVVQDTFASDDPCSNNARNLGILAGTILGAVIGNRVASKNRGAGTALGAGFGATLGGVIGNDIDRRRCELSKIARANNLDIIVSEIKSNSVTAAPKQDSRSSRGDNSVGLSVSVVDHGQQFAPGSSTLTPQAARAFADIATKYKIVADAEATKRDRDLADTRNQQIRILLVGHTDDTGSSRLNADLSEGRAREVAKIFAAKGFSPSQIFYQGAGETLPVATNHTESGRAKNRRVEIVDLSEENAFSAFLAQRRPNVDFYRPVDRSEAKGPDRTTTRKTEHQAIGKPPPSTTEASTAVQAEKSVPATQPRNAAGEQAGTEIAAKPISPAPSAEIKTKQSATGIQDSAIDFGGTLVNTTFKQVEIGKISKSSLFSIISPAYAADSPPVGSCAQDRPRVANGVKSLSNDQLAKISTADYLPGVYNSSWSGTVNGHLVALTNVAVLRDGGAPARKPNLLIYRDYDGNPRATANYRGTPEANAYQGDKALLFRVFSEGPVRCIDVVIPNSNPRSAPDSNLIYTRKEKFYQAGFSPSLAK